MQITLHSSWKTCIKWEYGILIWNSCITPLYVNKTVLFLLYYSLTLACVSMNVYKYVYCFISLSGLYVHMGYDCWGESICFATGVCDKCKWSVGHSGISAKGEKICAPVICVLKEEGGRGWGSGYVAAMNLLSLLWPIVIVWHWQLEGESRGLVGGGWQLFCYHKLTVSGWQLLYCHTFTLPRAIHFGSKLLC